MTKKFFSDVLASLLSSYVLAVWLDYNLIPKIFKIEPAVYGSIFGVLAIGKILLLFWLRKKQIHPLPQINKIFDLIFPFFLLSIVLLVVGTALYIMYFSGANDNNIGQKIMDSVSNDFTRSILDIYASTSQLILKPLGLLMFVVFSFISRLLGASLPIKNS